MTETVQRTPEAALREEVTHLRNRVDTLAEETKLPKAPWYKTASTLIALAAFAFSFGTTVVSYIRTKEQDTHNLRTELLGILQRLATLPKENVEAIIKYKDDPNNYAFVAGYLNQENIILARQANDAITRLPASQVSSTDYMAVAMALQASRNFDLALTMFEKSLAVANTLDDDTAVLRSLGNLEIIRGKVPEGRRHFQSAVDIFEEKYRTYDQFTKAYTTILTRMAWAGSEATIGNQDVARDQVGKAEAILVKMPGGPFTDQIRNQLMQTKMQILGPPPSSGPNPVLAPSVLQPSLPALPRAK